MSDNATTYLAEAEELKKLFESPELKEILHRQNVDWRFTTKRAPWFGGFWERLIGLTKTSLKKVLGGASVNLVTLQTIVVEIEAILNDRPLTYVSSDVKDEQPLTPSNLLYGRRIASLPNESLEEDKLIDPSFNGNVEIQRNAKRLTLLLQHFYRRWRQEYLTSLREFHKNTGTDIETIKILDIVQVHADNSRLTWKLAVVESLIRGRDGYVRSANIRTTSGKTNRTIGKLYPLEIAATTSEQDHAVKDCSQEANIQNDLRPKRTASHEAAERIKKWTQEQHAPPEDAINH